MYALYSDGYLVYAPGRVRDGYAAIAPKWVQEVGKADSLTFTLPPTNPRIGSPALMTSTIKLEEDGGAVFIGRVIKTERDFLNRKIFTCEGALGFLNDSVRRPHTSSASSLLYMGSLIANHNDQASGNRRIALGTGWDFSNSVSVNEEDYQLTLDLIMKYGMADPTDVILPRYVISSGVLTIYLDRLGVVNGNQVIQFGRNLLDLTEYLSAEDVYTVLIPIGKDDLTVASVNGGKDYITSASGVSAFGSVWRQEKFNDMETAADLLSAGQAALQEAVGAALSLTFKAVDLKAAGLSPDGFEIGRWYRVLSPPHGIDARYQLTRISRDLVDPDKSVYEFGIERKTLSATVAGKK